MRRDLLEFRHRDEFTVELRTLTTFHAECLTKPEGGHQAWVRAKAEYEQWKVGASNFERMVSGALAEVNDIWDLRGQERGSSGVLQAQLTCALDAIRTHRNACDTADIEPEPHDLALWSTLEHVAATDDTLMSQCGSPKPEHCA